MEINNVKRKQHFILWWFIFLENKISNNNLKVNRFVHPDIFDEYKEKGLQMGFKVVESGPLVRSSYHAEKHLF